MGQITHTKMKCQIDVAFFTFEEICLKKQLIRKVFFSVIFYSANTVVSSDSYTKTFSEVKVNEPGRKKI